MSLRPDLVACWLFRVAPGTPRLREAKLSVADQHEAGGRSANLEILLIRRAPDRPLYPGLWQCVTGGLEPGERIIDGALREVREETGLGPGDIEAFFESDIVNAFHERSLDAILVEAVFAARVRPTAVVRLSDEHDDARWLAPAEASALVVWPAYRRAIEQVQWLVEHPELAEAYRLPDPT